VLISIPENIKENIGIYIEHIPSGKIDVGIIE
jgi:hypothetical protein